MNPEQSRRRSMVVDNPTSEPPVISSTMVDLKTQALHHFSFSGKVVPLPPPQPSEPPRQLSLQDFVYGYPFVPFNRESGIATKIRFRGYWDHWNSQLPFRGKLTLTTTFQDPLWQRHEIRGIHTSEAWHKVSLSHTRLIIFLMVFASAVLPDDSICTGEAT